MIVGHVKLQRITAAERDDRKRIEKKEKKEKEEEEERNRLTYNFVKYTLGLKHQVLIIWKFFIEIMFATYKRNVFIFGLEKFIWYAQKIM